MKQHSQLYLLFPESAQASSTSAFLVETIPAPLESYEQLLAGVMETVMFFRHERYFLLYDGANSASFDALLQSVGNGSQAYMGAQRLLHSLLLKGKDWRPRKRQQPGESFQMDYTPQGDNTFGEVAKRMGIWPADKVSFLLVNVTRGWAGRKTIDVEYGGNAMTLDMRSATVREVFDWFCQYRRPQRVHLPNTRKHGNDHRPAQRGQARQWCSDAEMEAMMHKAIGAAPLCRKLFWFDANRQQYVQLMNSGRPGLDAVYHGFHLEGGHLRANERDLNAIKHKIEQVV